MSAPNMVIPVHDKLIIPSDIKYVAKGGFGVIQKFNNVAIKRQDAYSDICLATAELVIMKTLSNTYIEKR